MNPRHRRVVSVKTPFKMDTNTTQYLTPIKYQSSRSILAFPHDNISVSQMETTIPKQENEQHLERGIRQPQAAVCPGGFPFSTRLIEVSDEPQPCKKFLLFRESV